MANKAKAKPVVDCDICVACGECAETCPRLAITIKHGICSTIDYSRCVGCATCAAVCPASAITMVAADPL